MITFPEIQPYIFKLGMFEVRWYGLLYIISFIIGQIFAKRNIQARNVSISKENYDNFIFSIMLGVIIGGRVGYILFYNLIYYIHNPLSMLAVWQGGMSFHGGALGVIISALIFCKKNKIDFYAVADPTIPFVAIGLGLGRLGNFINAELYGRVTNLPWGMIFPNSDGQPRHPSQLYELFLEGIVMFIVLQTMVYKTKIRGLIFWTFILLYGIFRFFIEFFREPDEHLGFVLNFMTMGQVLSATMILTGLIAIIVLVISNGKKKIEKH